MSTSARPSSYAINRDELTSTVLKDIAIPANSILAPSYPGYQQTIADEAMFDPADGQGRYGQGRLSRRQGLPADRDLVSRTGWLQRAPSPRRCSSTCRRSSSRSWASTWPSSRCRPRTGRQALKDRTNNLFLAPYEYDYLDPSNFYGLFKSGGRHHYHYPGIRQAGGCRRRRCRLGPAPRRSTPRPSRS